MNWDAISLIIFYVIILIIFKKYRHRFTVQNRFFVLYKTKLGLKAMDNIARKFPWVVKWFGYLGVVVGFGGMAFILIFMIKETAKFLVVPGTVPPLAPVLPGVSIPGVPDLSFWHWIIAIFIVAVVHEFSHGVLARRYKIAIKSSGFAFLGPLLAAFVEPNEAKLAKSSKMKQLSVFAAGPFSNLILGFVFLLLLIFALGPLQAALFTPSGIMVGATMGGYPMGATNITVPFVINSINGFATPDFRSFADVTSKIKPHSKVLFSTDEGNYSVVTVENPDNKSLAFVGITGFGQKYSIISWPSLSWVPSVFMWLNILVLWLFMINLGVGLFNLLPLGPVDGGKMFLLAGTFLLKSEARAKKLWSIVSFICLALIIINLLPWLWKLILWILQGLVFIVALV